MYIGVSDFCLSLPSYKQTHNDKPRQNLSFVVVIPYLYKGNINLCRIGTILNLKMNNY